MLIPHRKLQSQQSAKDIENGKQLAAAKAAVATAEAEHEKKVASLKAALAAKDSEAQNGLAEVQKAAKAELEHAKRRTDAEIADLRATISSLEASFQKVGNKTQRKKITTY